MEKLPVRARWNWPTWPCMTTRRNSMAGSTEDSSLPVSGREGQPRHQYAPVAMAVDAVSPGNKDQATPTLHSEILLPPDFLWTLRRKLFWFVTRRFKACKRFHSFCRQEAVL